MKKFLTIIFGTIFIVVCALNVIAQPGNLLSASAKAEFNKENFAPCISEMSKLIKLQPKNDAAYFERGRGVFILVRAVKTVTKIFVPEKAKTISDEDKLIEATNVEFDSRRTRAIDDATTAIKLNPKNAAAL